VSFSESNSLRRELARDQRTELHPDADILSAFAEGALLERERQGVLTHLAICAVCREALHVAASAAEIEQVMAERKPAGSARPLLQGWFPWVVVAACALVASSVLLLQQMYQPGKGTGAETAKVEMRGVEQAPPATGVQRETPASVPPENRTRIRENPYKSQDNHEVSIPSPAVEAAPQVQMGERFSAQAKAANSDQTWAGVSADAMKKLEPQAAEGEARSAQVATARVFRAESGAPHTAGASPVASFAPRAATSNAVLRPRWRINELGQLERAFGDGAWQQARLQGTSKLRVVSISGSEVWAGGEKLRLEHSRDNGANWETVALPSKGDDDHAIIHIRFQSSQDGVIETDNGMTWKTVDGGRTWQ
jgi:hypothetical protein